MENWRKLSHNFYQILLNSSGSSIELNQGKRYLQMYTNGMDSDHSVHWLFCQSIQEGYQDEYFSYFFTKTWCCGYSSEALWQGTSDEYLHVLWITKKNLKFWGEKMAPKMLYLEICDFLLWNYCIMSSVSVQGQLKTLTRLQKCAVWSRSSMSAFLRHFSSLCDPF